MASEKITALVEQVKELTVLELSELVHTLQKLIKIRGGRAYDSKDRGGCRNVCH